MDAGLGVDIPDEDADAPLSRAWETSRPATMYTEWSAEASRVRRTDSICSWPEGTTQRSPCKSPDEGMLVSTGRWPLYGVMSIQTVACSPSIFGDSHQNMLK